jgi:hypothetical protein
MDQRTFDKGKQVRTAVLGEEYVRAAMRNADEFSRPHRIWSPGVAGVRSGRARCSPTWTRSSAAMLIGFVGLGSIGFPMARRTPRAT